MKKKPLKIWVPVLSALIVFCLLLPGCSQETSLVDDFHVPEGESLYLQTHISVAYPDSGLYFSLSEIPASKQDRDFSSFLNVEFYDNQGHVFRPERIWDINGQRRDIVAFCNNIPQGTRIKQVKIEALRDLKGTRIRWWSGRLK